MGLLRALAFLTAVALCRELHAGSLNVTVKDAKGVPVPDAVVYATGQLRDLRPRSGRSSISETNNSFPT